MAIQAITHSTPDSGQSETAVLFPVYIHAAPAELVLLPDQTQTGMTSQQDLPINKYRRRHRKLIGQTIFS